MIPRVTQRSAGGMVSAPHAAAAAAGAATLAAGGTAIEAALATAAMLSVVYPHMTGLGGDGFWLIAAPGQEPQVIDGAGRAGAAVSKALYDAQGLRLVPWRGPLAANTVAGAVSAWQAAWAINAEWGGRLSLAAVFEEAIARAREGCIVSASHGGALACYRAELEHVTGFRDVHFVDGVPPRAGDRLRQPALADTFDALARDGLDGFYRGALAVKIVAGLRAAAAPLCALDLAAQRATRVRPLTLALPMARLYNCPPPSQGLASLIILGLFARLGDARAESFEYVHDLVESTKRAFEIRDREVYDRVDGERVQGFLEPGELDRGALRIDRRRAAPWPSGAGAGDTAWFGAIDAAGRSVSAIQSLYFEFGSGVGLPECGFVWQNRGSAFKLVDQGPHHLAPGRKPFHTLNPAFARFHDGRTMVYGAMGGDGQPQTQAALFTRYAFYGEDLQAALAAPRWVLGRTWREATTTLRMESRFPAALLAELAAAGHVVEPVGEFDQAMGHAGAVVHQPGRGFEGASDPRSDGAAVGV